MIILVWLIMTTSGKILKFRNPRSLKLRSHCQGNLYMSRDNGGDGATFWCSTKNTSKLLETITKRYEKEKQKKTKKNLWLPKSHINPFHN